MHDFHGTIHLLDEPDQVLDAKVTVDLNRVLVRADLNVPMKDGKVTDYTVRGKDTGTVKVIVNGQTKSVPVVKLTDKQGGAQ